MLDNANTTVVILLVVIAGVSVVKNISDIIAQWIRRPSLDKDLQNYMPRPEIVRNLTQLREENLQSCKMQNNTVNSKFKELQEEDNRLWQKLNGMDRTNTVNQKDIQRTLGRIEGQVLKLADQA